MSERKERLVTHSKVDLLMCCVGEFQQHLLAGNAAQHNKVKKFFCLLRRNFSHKNLQMKVKLFDLSKMVIKLKYK
jgi:hypothetical protein